MEFITFQTRGAHHIYVNPARADPDLYDKHLNRIEPAGMQDFSTSSALCVMFGICMRSSIQEPRPSGSGKYLKEIAITPISVEFERAIAFYAEVLGDNIYVNTFGGNVTFSTKQSASSTPTQPAYAGNSGKSYATRVSHTC